MRYTQTLVLLTLMLFSHSCHQQQKKKDLLPVNLDKELVAPTSNKQSNTSPFFPYNNDPINPVVRTMFQDSKGILWFGTQGGAYKLVEDSLFHMNQITNASGKGVTIKDFTESKDGKIWLGHSDGISSIDGNTLTNYQESDGLISNDVWTIEADNQGNLWIGTIEGVSVFDGQAFKDFILPGGQVDTTLGVSSTKIVHQIFKDSNGTMWLSSNSGLFSYKNNTLQDISKKVGIKTNFINEVYETEAKEIWVSTKDDLYHLVNESADNITEGKIETGKGIGSITEDKDGKLWFVSNQHFLYTYYKNTITEFKKTEFNKGPVVFKIFTDQDKRLWFIGAGGAFRLENGKFKHITINGPW